MTHAATCGLYYKHITIINDDTSIVNKFEASLTDDARVVIYNRHMFIVQATGGRNWQLISPHWLCWKIKSFKRKKKNQFKYFSSFSFFNLNLFSNFVIFDSRFSAATFDPMITLLNDICQYLPIFLSYSYLNGEDQCPRERRDIQNNDIQPNETQLNYSSKWQSI